MARGKARARESHPEDELRQLQDALKKGLAPGYVLRGEERFFRDRALRMVIDAATSAGQELCRHDAGDPEFQPARLLDDLSGGSLFAGARCVVLESAPKVLQPSGKAYVAAAIPALTARVESGDEGCIVLVGDSLPATGKAVKALTKAGAQTCSTRRLWDSPPPWDPDPRKAEVVQWLAARARTKRVPLSLDEAAYVVAAKGADLYALDGELDRLSQRPDGQGIQELVGWSSGASPFEVAEHLVSGRAARAVAGIEALFQGGFQGKDGTRTLDHPALVTLLLSALTGKARESLAGAQAMAEGANAKEARDLAGVRGGVMAGKAFDARIGLRTPAQWAGLLDAIGDVERKARSTAGVEATHFSLLALEWRVQARRRAAAR